MIAVAIGWFCVGAIATILALEIASRIIARRHPTPPVLGVRWGDLDESGKEAIIAAVARAWDRQRLADVVRGGDDGAG